MLGQGLVDGVVVVADWVKIGLVMFISGTGLLPVGPGTMVLSRV
jgi:hypothetical protein